MSANAGWKSGPDALTKTPPVWGAHVGSPQVESTDYTPIASDYAPSLPPVEPPPETRQVWGPPPDWKPPEPPPPPPKPEPKRFDTVEAVKDEIESLYQRVDDGRMTSIEAKRRVDIVMARVLLFETLESAQLAAKVAATLKKRTTRKFA